MKLTDQSVAKALGWRYSYKQGGWIKPGDTFTHGAPPPYTRSLDAITAEIEARGLWWELNPLLNKRRKDASGQFYKKGHYALVGKDWSSIHKSYRGDGPAPFALCAALLAYLKEKS